MSVLLGFRPLCWSPQRHSDRFDWQVRRKDDIFGGMSKPLELYDSGVKYDQTVPRSPSKRNLVIQSYTSGLLRLIDRWWWGLCVVLILIAAVRWHRLDVPLERDEGEYAYAGQLMLQGVPPYVSAYNMKLPGIYLVYAIVLGVWGETVWAIHFALLLTNLASIILVFLIGRRLIDDVGGLFGAAAFAVFSLHQSVSGLFANSEHFVNLPMLGGTLLLLMALERDRLWQWGAVGVLMGTAFIIKQHGVMFIGFGAGVIALTAVTERPVVRQPFLRRSSAYLAGAVLPFVAICLWMVWAGVFSRFWFWTFTYSPHYIAQRSWSQGASRLVFQLSTMGGGLWGLWLLAMIGASRTLLVPALRNRWIVWVMWALASMAAVCPGFYFRGHYFLYVLPVSGLFVGAAISGMTQRGAEGRASRGGMMVLIAAAFLVAIYPQSDILIRWPDEAVSRSVYGNNLFPETRKIAEYIQRHTTPQDTIAVIGSEPQIYFYAQRRSATGHIYTYAMMEAHPFAREMQREMIQQIEAAQPRFIVYVNFHQSWAARPESFPDLQDWSRKYTAENYELAGLVQLSPTGTESVWDTAALGRTLPGPESSWLSVYRRTRN